MKQYIVLYGAVDTSSGYGARARDIAKVLIDSNKYDVSIISCPWGTTPKGFLDAANKDHKNILDRIITGNLTRQPDIFIMNSVPNEMQKWGKYNLLITAGIETTVCDMSWIEGCNRADLVLVSSTHAKSVFENSKFEERNSTNNALIRKIELNTKIDVLFEGVNTNIYKHLDTYDTLENINVVLDGIEEDFCFLFCGHWLKGDLGQDRKDVGGLIKTFLETFKSVAKPPALILKTSGGSYSLMDKEEIVSKIEQIREHVGDDLPNIYLLHGELIDDEVNILYNHSKVKAMVSFTKGEGFGRPLLEFTTSQKPVIASNWSGQLDFLSKEYSVLLPGVLTLIHRSAQQPNMLIENSSWFSVNYKLASKLLEDVWKSYKKYLDLSIKQTEVSITKFNLDEMSSKLITILDTNVPQLLELKLPTIKPLSLPTLKTI